jgi:hypothetical protein
MCMSNCTHISGGIKIKNIGNACMIAHTCVASGITLKTICFFQ